MTDDRASRWAREQTDDGFSLVEMMFVLAVIGVLILFVAPSFLDLRNTNKDSSAKRVIDASIVSATWSFQDLGSYVHADATKLKSSTSVTAAFVVGTTASTSSDFVSVQIVGAAGTSWYAASHADAGVDCLLAKHIAGRPQYAIATTGLCSGSRASTDGTLIWKATW